MKMRDELELYKNKAAELTELLDTVQRETELVVANLKDEHSEYREIQRTDFEKKFKDKDDQYQRRQADVTRLQEQINNLQDILDVIPGVMSRKKEDNYTENACHVRLASVLAQKFM
jgi:chromosome segregation ATPase